MTSPFRIAASASQAAGRGLLVFALVAGIAPAAAQAKTVTVRAEGEFASVIPPTTVEVGTGAGTDVATGCLDDSASAALNLAASGDWDLAQYVQMIKGERHDFSTRSDFWEFYVNGASQMVGACAKHLTDGDEVLFQATLSDNTTYESLARPGALTGIPTTTVKDGIPVVPASTPLGLTLTLFSGGQTGRDGYVVGAGAQSTPVASDGTVSVPLTGLSGAVKVQARATAATNWGRSALQTICVEAAPNECSRKVSAPSTAALGSVPSGTVSPAQEITFAATHLPVTASRVVVEGTGSEDVLIARDTCSGVKIAAGATCSVRLRYAPSAVGATAAKLVLVSDAAGGRASVNLTGSGTSAPIGATGATGATGVTGAQGVTGGQGVTGATGLQGTIGAQGLRGDAGAKGDAGAAGAAGPQGPKGDTGAAGRGVITLETSKATTSVKAGRAANVTFTVRNASAVVFPKATARATAPGIVAGKPKVTVNTIKAGASRKVTLRVPVATTARRGTHDLKVQLSVGDRSVTGVARLRVTR